MADVKISQLPSASTPLAGTEVLPIVQSGVTSKVAISDVTAGRAVSMTSVTVADGSASTPSITNDGDTNTGIFFPAADTIAFAEGGVESMRITDVGNVGIGTNAPISTFGRSLHLYNDASTGTVASNSYLLVESSTRNATVEISGSSTSVNSIGFSDTPGTTVAGIASSIPDSNLIFRTGGTTERMRIDSSGNVGIGTSSPGYKFQVTSATENGAFFTDGTRSFSIINSSAAGGPVIGAFSNHPLLITTNNTERARIDSSGLMGIGMSTAGTVRLAVASSSGFIMVGRDSTGTTDQFRIASNGNVTNINNIYGAISDAKLKENIVDATPKLDKLNQVRVVNYNLKGESLKQIGVVAQELEQIFPGMIDETPDLDADGNDLGTTTKSVKYSVFVPMLIKAIQELKAEFDAYKATHP